MQPGSIFNIPHYLSASTPSGLMRIMRRNNAKHGKQFAYMTPSFVNGKWFTWYFDNIDESVKLGEDLRVK